MADKFSFLITKKSSSSSARLGTLNTPHGQVQTPAFAVVATKADVKAVEVSFLENTKTQLVLANTSHLYLEPGEDVVAQAGGFGKFMGWNGPTMTDSGGFQVFSLGAAFGKGVSKVAKGEALFVDKNLVPGEVEEQKSLVTIDDDGVTFKSHKDGSSHRFTPERSMEIQWKLGADMIFAFDECTSPTAPKEYQLQALDRTHAWALRSLEAHEKLDPENVQALFAVVQGGQYEDLRKRSATTLAEMKTSTGAQFDGFGIGGSFTKDDLPVAVKAVTDSLPENKPRHLLGIGEPLDILDGVAVGCDTFDCIIPTRHARHGGVFTKNGRMNLINAEYITDFTPIEIDCECSTCKRFTKAYLSHLYRSKEMLAATLASVHNIYFLEKLMKDIRTAIEEGNFEEFSEEFKKEYKVSE